MLKMSYRDQWHKPHTTSITILLTFTLIIPVHCFNNKLGKAMFSRMHQELFEFNTEIMICGENGQPNNDARVYAVLISLEILSNIACFYNSDSNEGI